MYGESGGRQCDRTVRGVAIARVLVKESPSEVRSDTDGKAEASRSLSSVLVSMTVMETTGAN